MTANQAEFPIDSEPVAPLVRATMANGAGDEGLVFTLNLRLRASMSVASGWNV
jgi:hypothetical protein